MARNLEEPDASPPMSPLSVFSKSPSLPPATIASLSEVAQRYPSPSSSAPTSGRASPMKRSQNMEGTATPGNDATPKAKRRRVNAPPRPRTTERVNLEELTEGSEDTLDRLLAALRKKKRIVVIAGAGISVSAGIPDFRSSTGLFSTLGRQHKVKATGKHLFDASVYKHDSSTESFHTMVRELAHLTSEAKPTPFHRMLASLAVEGRLMRLYTQNVDGIDTSIPPLATRVPLNTKAPWPLTIQLHGGLDKMVCTKCGDLRDFDGAQFDGAEAPLCVPCLEHDNVRTIHGGKRSHGVGRLRPRMVLYNEYNPDEEAIGNVTKADLRRVPDAVIVVGTTLKIPGLRRIVKEMCQVTRSRRDGITAWINIDPEPQGPEFKDCWDIVVRGRSDDVAELTALVPWDEQGSGALDNSGLTKDVADRVKIETENVAPGFTMESVETLLFDDRRDSTISRAASGVVVEIPSRGLDNVQQGGIPTPIASPKLRSPIPHKSLQHGKTKQSRLSFVKGPSAQSSALEATKPAKPKKSRQPKSKPGSSLPPQGSINKTFKATKRSARSGPVDAKEPLFESDLNSLPALRPSTLRAGVKPYRDSSSEVSSAPHSRPTTPRLRQGTLEAVAISPRSKPNKMGHLID